MTFSSITFLVYFLPIFLLAYHLTPNKLKNACILIFSIVFYAWGGPKFIFVILGTTFFDFLCLNTSSYHISNDAYTSITIIPLKWPSITLRDVYCRQSARRNNGSEEDIRSHRCRCGEVKCGVVQCDLSWCKEVRCKV